MMDPDTPTVGWCDLVRWMAPAQGARHDDGIYHDRDWWETYFADRFKRLEEEYDPDGFMLLENRMMASHKFGRRYVIPYGGKSHYRNIWKNPFSIDGTASGTVYLVSIHLIKKNDDPTD